MVRVVVLALVAAVGVLAGVAGTLLLREPPPDEAAVRAIVAEALDARPDDLETRVEAYLLGNPRILERVSVALREELRIEEMEMSRVALASLRDEIYDDPDHVVLGNPEGDVTLVEMIDYNCGYCRSAMPDLAQLLEEDANLRVILKEFPILSDDSIDAARVGVVVARRGGDYWAFHEALFTARGRIDAQAALAAAEQAGLSRVAVELDLQSDEVDEAIQRSYRIAQTLGISGTPTYIIGNEIVHGAVGLDALRTRIANMRECGETVCDAASSPARDG